MNNFSVRLKEERNRLGLNQTDFAAAGGVKKLAQFSYEQGDRFPDVEYLYGISNIGVDIVYLLTGQLSTNALTKDESEIVTGFRGLDLLGKAGVIALIHGMSTTAQNNIKGDVGQVVQGNVQGPITINLKSKFKKNE